jgi:2-oxoglutarate ferredoxin oxidoreductase subunit beta
MKGEGFNLVEFLSPCPTNLHLDPVEAALWVKEKVASYFPLGEFKG